MHLSIGTGKSLLLQFGQQASRHIWIHDHHNSKQECDVWMAWRYTQV